MVPHELEAFLSVGKREYKNRVKELHQVSGMRILYCGPVTLPVGRPYYWTPVTMECNG